MSHPVKTPAVSNRRAAAGVAVEFKAGDHVVDPAHGLAAVVEISREQVAGFSVECLVVCVDHPRMTLRIPMAKVAARGLRRISGEADIAAVVGIVAGKPKAARGLWVRRAKEYVAKINSGDLRMAAEVVRDLCRSQAGEDDVSYSQRMLFEQAMARLVAEASVVWNMTRSQARAEFDASLSLAAPARKARAAEVAGGEVGVAA